jgi:REP element-mobilizing transposase RayT
MPDHAHLLCRLPPTVFLQTLSAKLKAQLRFASIRKFIHDSNFTGRKVIVLTLRKDELEKVSAYIDRQEEHHRRNTLSELLETFETELDDWNELIREKAS